MASKKRKATGLPPGAIVFTGDRKVDKIDLHYIAYNEASFKEIHLDNQSITALHTPQPDKVQWYDVRGLHDTELIEELGKVFLVHPLALEDIADIYQRPKLDEYEHGIFISLKALSLDKKNRQVQQEHVAIYLGNGFVLTFQERSDDLFRPIRNRLERSGGRIRKRGADYLVYAFLDMLVDQYLLVLDEVEEVVESIEDEIVSNIPKDARKDIYELKKELIRIRRSVVPLRELTRGLLETEHELLTEATSFYLRDLRDHTFHVLELIEVYRDKLNGLQDLYLAELSHSMNNVMQTLTIVATIFIPLTFVAGIYGMNFLNMPELEWEYGYPAIWTLMVLLAVVMLWFFRKRKWL